MGSVFYKNIGFFYGPNLSSRAVAMKLTQPQTEMNTTTLLRELKGLMPAREADNLAAISEPSAKSPDNV
jgi:hypothetical protein